MVFSILLPQPLTSFGVDSGIADSVGMSSLSNRVITETPAVSLHGYEGFLPKKDINPWIYDGIGHCKS